MPSQPARSVHVDKALCASFGRCVAALPAAFAFDDDDQAVPTEAASELSELQLRDVVEACPTGAISLLDTAS